jgi:L-ascorbate metabolism protein UlaG (beta-lactamase superfamily)
MARFSHRLAGPNRGPSDLLKWRWDNLVNPRGSPDADTPAPRVANDGRAIQALPSSLTWVGHASFAVRLGGKTALIDPIWSDKISGVVPRRVAPGVALADLGQVDLVLLTHNHRDHFDVPTLKQIGSKPLYVVPLGNGGLVRALGHERVVELDWWQTHREGDLEVTLVPARHWSMRLPWDRNEMLWGGYVLKGPEGAAYHTGDTGFFETFKEIGARLGPINWAMLPIGAYEPRWFMEPQHMNPDDALKAFDLLQARHFVAMHWGTFRLTDEPLGEPPRLLREKWAKAGRDPSRLWLVDVGETRPLTRSTP